MSGDKSGETRAELEAKEFGEVPGARAKPLRWFAGVSVRRGSESMAAQEFCAVEQRERVELVLRRLRGG
jgi:hypothetical protein